MKIFVNTSNLKKGGALQVAHSFLTEIKENTEHEFHVVLSSTLSDQITPQKYPENFTFYHYSIKTSAFKVITGIDDFLYNLENTVNPDCIFTVFGPSYWIPKNKKHLVGYAIPHYIYPESPYFSILSLKAKIRLHVLKFLHKINLKKSKAFFWVETKDVKLRLAKFINKDIDKIHVISNTTHKVFNNFISNPTNQSNINSILVKDNCFKFITISAAYPHKNLEILLKVIPILKSKKINCKFFLTLDNYSFKPFAKLTDYIINLGPVSIEECPKLYYNSDALFLPTLLECFTASYPESMIMGKPILTSDLSFAHDICGNAAEYFNPLDAGDIASKIEKIVYDEKRREYLVEEGYKQLSKFETAKSRTEKFLQICKMV